MASGGRVEAGLWRDIGCFAAYLGFAVVAYSVAVATEILDPRQTWEDKEAYDERAEELANLFAENFKKFEDEVDEEVLKAGPAS